jgi:hypothetical protein
MLETKVVNLKENQVSSSTRVFKGFKCISSLALELMVMAKFEPFDNNQCPIDWFKTQVEITRLKQSIIV